MQFRVTSWSAPRTHTVALSIDASNGRRQRCFGFPGRCRRHPSHDRDSADAVVKTSISRFGREAPTHQSGRLGSSAFVCWRAERHRSGVGGRGSPAPRRDGIGTCIGEQRAVAEWKVSTCNTGGGQPQSSQADRNLRWHRGRGLLQAVALDADSHAQTPSKSTKYPSTEISGIASVTTFAALRNSSQW